MAALNLLRDEYRDRVLGAWVGRCAGATLGAPFDGSRELRNLTHYEPTPGQPAGSDGLDFQLAWLEAVEAQGADINSEVLARAWQAGLTYPWDEYGWAQTNLRRGLCPPLTGSYDNWYGQSLRGVGRCDLWGLISPGEPQLAAELAWRDSSIDHAGEGVWAAMLWAAMESAAFFVKDVGALVDVGLAMVPENSRTARAARVVRDSHRQGATLLDTRTRALEAVGSENVMDAPQNMAAALMGLHYGEGDFGRSVCTVVNLGMATQINAAAAGALLGILHGRSRLPTAWAAPMGNTVVVGWGLNLTNPPRSLDQLADRTAAVGKRILAERGAQAEIVEKLPQPPPLPEAVVAASGSEPILPGIQNPPNPPSPEPRAEPVVADSPADSNDATAVTVAASLSVGDLARPVSAEPAPAEGETVLESNGTLHWAGAAVEQIADSGARPILESPEASAAPLHAAGETAAPSSGIDPGAQPEEAAIAPDGVTAIPAAPAPPPVNWRANESVLPLLAASPTTAVYHAAGFEFTVDYGSNGPVILPGVAASFTVEVRNRSGADFLGLVQISLPEGWQFAVPGAQGHRQMLADGGMARYGFVLKAPESAAIFARNKVSIVLTPEQGKAASVDVVMIGGACWYLVGPFANNADEGFMKGFEVEDKPGHDNSYLGRDGGIVRWQRRAFHGALMDLETEFRGVPGVVYLETNLHVASLTEARLVAHTNDGVRLWLNDQLVLQRHSHEPFRPTAGYGTASADVTLRAGDNRVMVKVVRCGAPAQFNFHAADRDGRVLVDTGNTRW